MKKILILTTIGGFLPQFEMNDVNILLEQGYEIHYATNFDNPVYELDCRRLEEMGIRLHPVRIQKSPFRLGDNLVALKEIITIIRKEQIGVVHCHNPIGGVLGRLAGLLAGSPAPYVIYTAHGFHFYEGAPALNWLLYYPIERLLARYTDCLVTINKEDNARARRFRAGRLKEIYGIPGVGVHTDRFEPDGNIRKQVRSSCQIGDHIFYLLSVGELNHNKNHEVIIRALALLQDPDIHYGICGKGYRREYLEKLAKNLGVENQVTFFGFRSDIPDMLQGADCFIFPSLREGLGIAALEAMAAGKPMITSDCRGTREYMRDGVTGYMAKRGSAEEYAELIRKMKKEPDRQRKMSAFCRKISADFDICRTDRIMRKVYGNIKSWNRKYDSEPGQDGNK